MQVFRWNSLQKSLQKTFLVQGEVRKAQEGRHFGSASLPHSITDFNMLTIKHTIDNVVSKVYSLNFEIIFFNFQNIIITLFKTEDLLKCLKKQSTV